MKTGAQLLIDTLKMQERLFRNVLAEFEDKEKFQVGPDAANASWIAGHTLNSRFYMLKLAGNDQTYRHADKYARGIKFSPEIQFPSLSDSLEDLAMVSPLLYAQLEQLDAAKWAEKAPYAFPLGDSFMDTIGFMAHHEAYHIGQISLIRRAAGLPGMSYK